MTRSRWTHALQVVLAIVAIVAVVVAFLQSWEQSRELTVPSWERLAGTATLVATGLVCGANGWLHLLQRRRSRRLAATFYLSQIGKYIPGAIWQPAGQLAMAVTTGVSPAAASTALPVYMLTLIAAGATVGLVLVAIASDLPVAARLLLLLGLVPIALLRREWMSRSLDRLHARFNMIPTGAVVPEQHAILAAYAWGIGVMLTTGTAFHLLLDWYGTSDDVGSVVPGFALAWTVGFLALPVPAGLGVREGVLFAVLGSGARPGAVLAASLLYRLVSIGVEVMAVLVTRLESRLHRRGS